MTLEELTVAYQNLQQISTFAAGMLLLVGLYLALAPIGSCDRCAHCKQERVNRTPRGPITYCRQHNRPRSECEQEHRP